MVVEPPRCPAFALARAEALSGADRAARSRSSVHLGGEPHSSGSWHPRARGAAEARSSSFG
jgi:hypothetical protein